MKISIIVPVYNVEKYIAKCIESLINQTYKNIEILLIDDGSQDASGLICDNYALNDNRIYVYHKKNGGLSDARNYGLLKANGDYILFVDSDDYIEVETCQKFFEIIEPNIDAIFGDSFWVYPCFQKEICKKNVKPYKTYSGKQFFLEQLKSNHISMQAWLGIYSRDFLIKNSLFFEKGILHEDERWTPQLLAKAVKVKYLNFPFYHYIIRENSITQSKDKTKNAIDLIDTCYFLDAFSEQSFDGELLSYYKSYILKTFFSAIIMCYQHGDMSKLQINKNFVAGKSKKIADLVKIALFKFNIKIFSKIYLYALKLRKGAR